MASYLDPYTVATQGLRSTVFNIAVQGLWPIPVDIIDTGSGSSESISRYTNKYFKKSTLAALLNIQSLYNIVLNPKSTASISGVILNSVEAIDPNYSKRKEDEELLMYMLMTKKF